MWYILNAQAQGVLLLGASILNVTLERNLALMMNSQPHLISAESMNRLLDRVDFYKDSVIPATYTKDYLFSCLWQKENISARNFKKSIYSWLTFINLEEQKKPRLEGSMECFGIYFQRDKGRWGEKGRFLSLWESPPFMSLCHMTVTQDMNLLFPQVVITNCFIWGSKEEEMGLAGFTEWHHVA